MPECIYMSVRIGSVTVANFNSCQSVTGLVHTTYLAATTTVLPVELARGVDLSYNYSHACDLESESYAV